jgi:ribosome recycling factor
MDTLTEVTKHAKQQMRKALDNTKRELATIRSGKATTSLLDTVRVEAYGQQVPLNQVGSVAAPEAQLLTVQPWDKSLLGTIEKAILTACRPSQRNAAKSWLRSFGS